MLDLRKIGALIICCVFLSACQQSFRLAERPVGGKPDNNKVALMPLDILLSEKTAGGMLEPNAVWTEQAKRNLLEGLRKNPSFGRAEVVEVSLPPVDSPDEKTFLSFQRLHSAVGASILAHSYQPALVLPTKGAKLDWTMGPLARQLQDKTKTRYALFLHVNDTYASGGRVALIIASALLFGVAPEGGTQTGFASLVDLETGDIVWFNHLSRNAGDLRNYASAQETIDTLFLGFPLGKDCGSC
ncbi:MAG: hypothetical protein HQL44_10605 [Alphaproteobacteria bacterium]|nr:hypothetical protein [Alphaproteobacteria bacterium]